MAVYKDDANIQLLLLFENDLTDESPNGNDLTNNNGVTFDNVDFQEGAYSADFEAGSSQSGSIADGSQSGLDITGDISVGCRIKAESLAAGTHGLITKWNPTSGERSWGLFVNSNGAITFLVSNDGSSVTTAITANSVISTGTWFHVVAVYNGTDIRIYVDGSLSSNGADNPKTYSSGIHSGSADVIVGTRDGSGGTFFDGKMDEGFVFDRELSSAEVADIDTNGIQDPAGGNPAIRRFGHTPIHGSLIQHRAKGLRYG